MMIPSRLAPIGFGFVLPCLMSLPVSGIATFRYIGVTEGFLGFWMEAWRPSWAIGFPVVLVVAPVARGARRARAERAVRVPPRARRAGNPASG